ncbi:MAG: hypothetical protein ABJB34_04320 [Acidobacteriota bacterium]
MSNHHFRGTRPRDPVAFFSLLQGIPAEKLSDLHAMIDELWNT